jgi:hypothetical protein
MIMTLASTPRHDPLTGEEQPGQDVDGSPLTAQIVAAHHAEALALAAEQDAWLKQELAALTSSKVSSPAHIAMGRKVIPAPPCIFP